MLIKADNLTIKAADHAVQWVWDRWGWAHKRIMTWARAIYMLACIVHYSDCGTDFGVSFWLFTGLMGLLIAWSHYNDMERTAETRNTIAAFARTHFMFRFIRITSWIFLAFNLGRGALDTWDVSTIGSTIWWVVFFLYVLVDNAITPTKPRKRKVRLAKAADWSWLFPQPQPVPARF